MTPDQIRQVAEEYARTQMDDLDQGYWDEERLSDRAYNSILDEYIESVIPIVQFIAERFCIVERSKVVEEYNKIKKGIYFDDMETTKFVDGRIFELEHLFGSETFNGKEE